MGKTLLFIGAHMDDNEGGAGGIMLQAVRAGHRVVAVVTVSDYTTWKATLGREAECKAQQLELARRFGYEKRFLDYPYHQFIADIEAKRKLAEIYVELQPDITFLNDVEDDWPDHVNTGIAGKDAVLFSHGLSHDLTIRRCPRVYSFFPKVADFFVDVTDVMPDWMELMQNTDSCLDGRPPQELLERRVTDLRTGQALTASWHGWYHLTRCAVWGSETGLGTYALGLRTLWGPRDGRPLW